MGFFSFFAPKKKQAAKMPERPFPIRRSSQGNGSAQGTYKSADNTASDILNPLNPISPLIAWDDYSSGTAPIDSGNDFSGFGGGNSGGAGASGGWGSSSDSSNSYDSGSSYDSGASSCDSGDSGSSSFD